MRYIAYIILLVMTLFITPASGSPAYRGHMRLMQPDGSLISGVMTGDEFYRIKTTPEGHAIMQDDEGWWCYAFYRNDGTRENSGWRVGHEVPPWVLDRSSFIPSGIGTKIVTKARLAAAGMRQTGTGPIFGKGEEPVARHGIVILAQFQDIRFSNTRDDFEKMLMQHGYSAYGATGSAKDYFDAQFSGLADFRFDVSNIVTLPGKRSYYGKNDSYGNDANPEDMVTDACLLAAEDGVDFSLYDDDNDGYVDNVFIFFAGEDEAEGGAEDCIWSHAWYIYHGAGKYIQVGGKLIDRYACSAEMKRIYDSRGVLKEIRLSGIGTFCHEYCHTFGLPDMYDTDYDREGGWAAGLWGSTSIMDSGNQNNDGNTPPNFNAIEREILGIASVRTLDHDGSYTLDPIHLYNDCYRLETDREGEYYLFECRTNDKDPWDAYIGGSGMLVYHVDKSEEMAGRWQGLNTVNANSTHQCADLVEADGRTDSFTDYTDYLAKRKNIGSIFFPYGRNTSLTPSGSPGLKFWSGEEGRFSITNIERKDNGSIGFRVIGGSEETTPPSVRNTIDHETFHDGAIVLFESNRPFDGEAVIRYGKPGQDTTTVLVGPYQNGKYSVLLEGLEPAKTYFVDVAFHIDGSEGSARGITFMTKKQPVVDWPYIFFGRTRRNSNGTFLYDSRIPLKVYNSGDAREIRWTFNDQEITAEGDHYFSLPGDGVLKAHIVWEDGTEDILTKEINISPMMIE